MYLIKFEGNGLFYLHGPYVTGAVRGATYAPGCGEGAALEDTLDVQLEGTPEAIEQALEMIEMMLRDAEAVAVDGGGLFGAMPVYLCCVVEKDGRCWRSPVLGGWIESGPSGVDGRAAGAQVVRLRLRRANYWEWEGCKVTYLANANGSSGEGETAIPVRVRNHQDLDPGHVNYVTEGGMGHAQAVREPLPVRLEMALCDQSSPYPLTVMAGHWVYSGTQPAGLVIEGEDGTARGEVVGTAVIDAGSGNGQYLRLDWSGGAEGEAWAGDISGNAASLMNRPFRALLRLAQGGLLVDTQLWYRWRVYLVDAQGVEHRLYESAGRAMETASECIFGPTLHLPPWAVAPAELASEDDPPTLRLALVLQAEGEGAHALKLDFLQLLPLDGWRIYRPLDDQPTLALVDDGLADAPLAQVTNQYGWQSHAVEGPGLDLRPTTVSTFVFVVLRHAPAGITWPVDLEMAVGMAHRPRRRML